MESTKNRLFLGVVAVAKSIFLFVRNAEGKRNRPVSVLKSENGSVFFPTKDTLVFSKLRGNLWESPDVEDIFRMSFAGDRYYLSFKKRRANGTFCIMQGTSTDGIEWRNISEVSDVWDLGSVAPLKGGEWKYALFFGGRSIRLAFSMDLKKWNVRRATFLKSRENYFDSGNLLIGTALRAGNGILIMYASETDERFFVGAALADASDPKTILWRSDSPLWESPGEWRGKEVRLVGFVPMKGKVLMYWLVDGKLLVEEISQFWKVSHGKSISITSVGEAKLEKYHGNPIIGPREEHDWESYVTFNPSAFLSDDGMVHILYRAIGRNGLSTVGYANSKDGFSIHERLDHPIYIPTQHFDGANITLVKRPYSVQYFSGGGCGGSEDPRIVRVEDTLYMTYTAFDGNTPPRVALTSIPVEDFLARKWNWKRPVLISPPGEMNKNWVVFPEKIHGKYAVLHSVSPNVCVDYFDTLDFDGNTFIKSSYQWKPNKDRWDMFVRGVGPSPLRTKEGWLVLYHATTRDCGYKLSAMLLDLDDPTKVICRSHGPILEPKVWYENEGAKPRIVYSCGAIIKDEKLFVYYGSADTVSCVATVPIRNLLDSLLESNKVVPTRYVKLGDE